VYLSPDSPSQNFAPALIVLRVALGRARPDTAWSRTQISGLQFNSAPGVQESIRSRGVASMILTVPRSHPDKEVDLEANEEPQTEFSEGEETWMDRTDEEKARI
jgi:hypothetical protein